MTQTGIHRAFRPVRTVLPRWLADPVRGVATALLTPIRFSWRTGHFRSSLRRAAVSKSGDPLPWYTYPCIDFLAHRPWDGASVLEFGAGQSTLWWARRARRVVALEGDPGWAARLRRRISGNVELHLVAMDGPRACVESVERALADGSGGPFDVVVIDGLWRAEMIGIAARVVSPHGIIVCDDAEGYGFHEGFLGRDFLRVDFFGHAPGVILPHCTSICFRPHAVAFSAAHPVPVIASER